MDTIFISYSHKDEAWKDLLIPHLRMLERYGLVLVWDDRMIGQGDEWYPEIKAAMEKASVAVCLISANYLTSDFCKKEEIPYLLERRSRYSMALLPILMRPCLWEAIGWLKKIQMLPLDGRAVSELNQNECDNVFTEVARKISNIFNAPDYNPPPPPAPEWDPPEKLDIDRLPLTGAELFGRKKELELLDNAWGSGDTHVVSLAAWGGMGKTTLVNKWLVKMGEDNYRGARKVFAWSFHSAGERISSADQFTRKALEWFGDSEPDAGLSWDKGKRLAELAQMEKALLILDGLEPFQSSHEFDRGKLKEPALEMLITGLARKNPGLCIITTREKLTGIDRFSATVQQMDLEQISVEAGRTLLRVAGVRGTDAELEDATRQFGAHALALNLLARYLRGNKGHPISHANKIPDLNIDDEKGKHARRIMEAFKSRFGERQEMDLLHLLGLFDRPVEKEAIDAIRQGDAISGLTKQIQNINEADWMKLLKKLRKTGLVAEESQYYPDILDCHPQVREHFGEKLKKNNHQAWKKAHGRLYEYYKNLPEKELPDTLEEMEPLFSAVAHGCQAGQYKKTFYDVYWSRIKRREKQYNTEELGAYGSDLAALSCFFEIPWRTIPKGLKDEDKAYIWNWTGFSLKALGRLHEAAQPMKKGLEARIREENWDGACLIAINLSGVFLKLGKLEQAVDYAQRSVDYSEKSKEVSLQIRMLAAQAYALYKIGDFLKAEKLFQEAEAIQNKIQPNFTFLYSLQGFQFCDLFLSQGKYLEVQTRTSKTLQWAKEHLSLFDLALDKLSLGRAHLLQTITEKQNDFTPAETYLNEAVAGLRKAGQQQYLPLGLLARGGFNRVRQRFRNALDDLEEAREISEHGGMIIHLADYYLEASRIYLAQNKIKKAGGHLNHAEAMIKNMGYHLRDKDVVELRKKIEINGEMRLICNRQGVQD